MMDIGRILVLILFFDQTLGENFVCSTKKKNHYGRLKEDLFCNYDPTIRPVANLSTTIDLAFTFFVSGLQWNEKTDLLQLFTWIEFNWNDEFITWKKEEYGNISMVDFPSEKFWVPIVYVDRMYEPTLFNLGSFSSLTKNNGDIHMFKYETFFTHCVVQRLSNWPNDVQECNLTIGLLHPEDEVKLTFNKDKQIVNRQSTTGKEWEILSAEKVRQYPEEFSTILVIRMQLRRIYTIIPSVVTTPIILAIIFSLLSFWINPLENYRFIILLVSVFVHIVCLQFLGSLFPANKQNDSIAVLCIRISAMLSGLSMILHCITKRIVKATSARPKWLQSGISTLNKWRLLQILNKGAIYNTDGEGNWIDEDKKTMQEWVLVSALFDRLCFIIYTLFYIILSIVLLAYIL